MMIEILYFDGCPNHGQTLQLVREVTGTLGLSIEVREIEVVGPEEAESLRFLGSPSVRVDGCDIEPGADARTEFNFGCRMYGARGVPPRDMLVAALEAS